jgi:hypothetical protein
MKLLRSLFSFVLRGGQTESQVVGVEEGIDDDSSDAHEGVQQLRSRSVIEFTHPRVSRLLGQDTRVVAKVLEGAVLSRPTSNRYDESLNYGLWRCSIPQRRRVALNPTT